ncbi:isoprenyl transferase [Desulfobulbus rhabdoformis]|uniref:isoprenyl transferase n=1 Tax=Desulfobulbus rhabdoformis TaxID=34032 RepID=UPI00308419F2
METQEAESTIPRHVAIIMDGNGRWAQERHRPRLFGHKAGADTVREIVEVARKLGIGYLTLYAFSTENWKRPEGEVSGLMGILKNYLQSELRSMLKNDIRLNCIGQMQKLPADVQEILKKSIAETRSCTGMTLNLALNYGGRAEMVEAITRIGHDCRNGTLDPGAISEAVISEHLFTAGQPDPDLLIRTGGENRLSNFLLWQASYAELYFTEVKWPDFHQEAFLAALNSYSQRQRRFGQTGAQVSGA